MAFASDFHGHQAGIIDRTAAALKGLAHRVAQYRLYRKTVKELNTLSWRELDDLGLNRSMVKRAALEAAYGL